MAVKASTSITLSAVVDVASCTRYYLLQSSTLSPPAKPTAKPPAGSWSDTEPTYTSGSTNSLYFTDLTVFSDGTWSYSSVSRSSSYEAAKEAYNKAQNAQTIAQKALSNTEVVVGTQTAATNAWTGIVSFSSLVDGQQIVFWLPYASAANTTLNLTLADGSTTGAIPCYYGGTTRLGTHYAAGNAVHLTYRENANVGGQSYTGWWADANYNTNTNTYNCIQFDNYTWAKKAIPAGTIVVGDGDGYEPIGAGVTFSVNLPILYRTSALAKNKRDASFFLCYPAISLPTVTGDGSFALLSRHTAYVAGRLNGEMFTTLAEGWLTDTPDDTTGTIVYIALGRMSTAASASTQTNTSLYLYPEHPMYRMIDGVLTAVSQIAYEARLGAESAQETADNNTQSIQRLDQSVSGLSTQFNVFSSGIEATIEDQLSYTLQIPDDVYAAMTQRTHNAQIQITLTGANGTVYTTGRIECGDSTSGQRFKLAKSRTAPVISGVSWGESGTSHISTYGNLIAGKTIPTISFSVTLDTTADSGIGYESRELVLGDKTYTLSANSGTLQAVSASGSVAYTITVTDSYGQTGTLSGTITVLAYTAPTLRNVAINRYITTVNSGGSTVYELDDDGTSLWFDAEITVQTSLGSGTNKWSLKITPAGGTAINAVTNSSTASVTYTHNRTFITGSYANTSSFDFTVELSDAFTTITYQVSVPKAGGIFNIETTGVAVGMRSTGTDANPLFQSAYPAHFLAGAYGADGNRIDVSDDTGWQAVTLVNSAAYDSTTTPMARRRNKVIYVKGAIKLNATLSSYAQGATNRTQIGTLPTGIRPSDNYQFSIVVEARYIKFIIETDGKMYLMNHCGNAVGASLKISLACSFMEN